MTLICNILASKIKENVLQGYRFQPLRFQDEDYFKMPWSSISFFHQAQHILWMLSEIPKFPQECADESITCQGKYEKAHRWLGFVQGWMVMQNLCSVEFLRTLMSASQKEEERED